MENEMHALPNTAKNLHDSILAGNATLTLRGVQSGTRFTYKISPKKGTENPHFVKVLTGPDNESAYTFLGTIFADGNYRRGFRSTIGEQAPSNVMFRQVWARVQKMVQAGRESEAIPEIEVFHMGACLRCGRALTTPESITRGLGPDCAERE
jgi:hypothetical protein